MDLQKTGDYIASKRRSLGLTQAQLAEQLGMSDKSVSKWERGVCLPDTRVYVQLCEILGISVNEFIAGEDIAAEALPAKADENLVQVSADGSATRRKLLRILAAVGALALIFAVALALVIGARNEPLSSHVEPLPLQSTEVQAARLATGADGVYLFKIFSDGTITKMTVTLDTYLAGVPTGDHRELPFDLLPFGTTGLPGMLALTPTTKDATLHLAFDDGGNVVYATDLALPEGAALGDPEALARGTMAVGDPFDITPGETYPLFAVNFDDDDEGFMTLYPEDSDGLRTTDVYYLISVQFL